MAWQDKSYDLVVVGGGIFGLWVAKYAVERGLRVLLAEKERIGAGASGGILGALIPHLPTLWNDKKQFQFHALAELSGLVADLEAETGMTTGYARTGRLMPLTGAHLLPLAQENERASGDLWQQAPYHFSFSIAADQRYDAWLSCARARHGYMLDTLAARIEPRAYLRALASWVEERASLVPGLSYDGFGDNVVSFNNGRERIKSAAVVLAQGHDTFRHLKTQYALDLGHGIKGEAACFKLSGFEDMPVIYEDRIYIIPHANGFCSVGSTSEKDWTDPHTPDPQRYDFIDRATALCPALASAPLIERWAGVRPKSHLREPVIGRLFDDQALYIATGGFKVSFGIAHRVAEALADDIAGQKSRVTLPETFTTAYHLKTATPADRSA